MPKSEIDRVGREDRLSPAQPGGAEPPPGAASETENSDQIGAELRRLYDDVANEPLPDRFRDLLDRLKKESGDGDA